MSKNYNQTLQTNNSSLEEIITQLNNMPDAGGSAAPVLQDKTVTPTTSQQTITADGGYDGLDTVTVNAMPTATQATPSITVNASGLITATATQTAGYVAAGTKSATQQLAFQAAKTITPTTVSQTAVSSGYYTGGNVTVAGDSNLVAGNIKNGVSIFGVSGTYVGDGGGSSGDTSMEDALISEELTAYTNSRVTSLKKQAFANQRSLVSVYFQNCTTIGDSAFANCTVLAKVSFPACTSINNCAFSGCSSLKSITFPLCTNIGQSAFYWCSNLISVSFSQCTNIRPEAFRSCSSLTSVSFPVCYSVGSSAFNACSRLVTANLPACVTIYNSAFYRCSKLTNISVPVCTSIGTSAFASCTQLTNIILPACLYIGTTAFYNCGQLTTIELTGSILCSLVNSNAFSSTKITSTTGSIYVPASLVNSYKSATNWTYFSNRIFSI